jgi:hypothetical protein
VKVTKPLSLTPAGLFPLPVVLCCNFSMIFNAHIPVGNSEVEV